MPSLLKRVVFQVGSVPNERAFALSSVSNDGHFVSLRPLCKPVTKAEKEFPFEWAFGGTNRDVTVTEVKEGVVKQDFNFGFDANVYLNTPNTHRGLIETLWENWDSGCIAETGKVYPAGVDKEGVSFFELWQPVDPSKEELVMEASDTGKSIVFKTKNGSGYDGLFIVTGQWSQGFLSKNGEGTTKGLNFIRLLERPSGLKILLRYGVDFEKFPTKVCGVSKGDVLNFGGIEWEVIESHI